MFPTPKEKSRLDIEIDQLILELKDHESTSEEYAKIVEQLNRLMKIRSENRPARVSPDTWATIGANLLGIVMITWFERENVITSKASGFIQRIRN
jgi:hypothetical protein